MYIAPAARMALLSSLMAASAGAWANSYKIIDLGADRYPVGINNDARPSRR